MISIRGEDLLVAPGTGVIGQSISNRYQGSAAVGAGDSAGGMSVTGPAIPVSLSARRGRVARTPVNGGGHPPTVLPGYP